MEQVTSSTSWATNAVSAPGAVVAILKRHFFQKTIDSNLYLRFGVRPVMRQMAYVRSPLFMSMLWPFAGLSNEEMEKVSPLTLTLTPTPTLFPSML